MMNFSSWSRIPERNYLTTTIKDNNFVVKDKFNDLGQTNLGPIQDEMRKKMLKLKIG